MKILIVEDEPALRELIQRSLEKERYVIETAVDFDSALDKIEVYDYDCIRENFSNNLIFRQL